MRSDSVSEISKPPARKPSPFVLLAILVATALLYLPSLRFDFVYDDRYQIMRNPRLTSWQYLPGYFQHHLWFHNVPYGGYFRPFFLIWLRLNYVCFGLRPAAFHITTVLLHLVAIVLVWQLLRKTISDGFVVNVATAVFALHPTHIETVAWVSGLTDSLMSIPLLGSLLCWVAYLRRPKLMRLIASLLLFVIALLAKESAMIGLVLVACYTYALTDQNPLRVRLKKSGLSLLVFLPVFIAFWTVRYLLLAHELVKYNRPLDPLANVATMGPLYLWHLLWPMRLSLYYDVPSRTFSLAALPLGLLAIWVAIGAGLLAAQRSRELFLAWAWIVLPIGSAIGGAMIFARFDSFHDRYLYLATIGFGILAGILFAQLRFGPLVFGRPASQVIAVAVLLSGYAFGLLHQEPYWRDNFALFARTTSVAPQNPMSYTHLGRELDLHNDPRAARDLLAKAIALDPKDYGSNLAAGALSLQLEAFDDAIRYCQQANRAEPGWKDDCYRIEARAYMAKGQVADAETVMRAAIKRWPAEPGDHLLLGHILVAEGRNDEAHQEFLTELLVDPGSNSARYEASKFAP